jgi:hypothetical protein
MTYSAEALAQLVDGHAAIPGTAGQLTERFLLWPFNSARAREMAIEGFVRRVRTMARCIENVFRELPPSTEGEPDDNVRHNAEVNVQAAVVHAFGACDNLAWIWVSERAIVEPNGAPLRDQWVGLKPGHNLVRNSFSAEFRDHIATFDDWFDRYLKNFRDALVHRIPLYIPPFVVQQDDEARYRALEHSRLQAALIGDHALANQISNDIAALKRFRAWMQHSFIDEAAPIAFHAQMLADFNTVADLGNRVLDELDRQEKQALA